MAKQTKRKGSLRRTKRGGGESTDSISIADLTYTVNQKHYFPENFITTQNVNLVVDGKTPLEFYTEGLQEILDSVQNDGRYNNLIKKLKELIQRIKKVLKYEDVKVFNTNKKKYLNVDNDGNVSLIDNKEKVGIATVRTENDPQILKFGDGPEIKVQKGIDKTNFLSFTDPNRSYSFGWHNRKGWKGLSLFQGRDKYELQIVNESLNESFNDAFVGDVPAYTIKELKDLIRGRNSEIYSLKQKKKNIP